MLRSVLCALALGSVGIQAATPSTMLFQGSMTVDGKTPSAPTTLVVALYDDATAGTKIWEESFADVKFSGGYFAVQLGSSKALPTFDKPLFVQLAAGGKDAAARVPLTTAPYAQRAAVADSAGVAKTASTAKGVDAPWVELPVSAEGTSRVLAKKLLNTGTLEKTSQLIMQPDSGKTTLYSYNGSSSAKLVVHHDHISISSSQETVGIVLPKTTEATDGGACTIENLVVLGNTTSSVGPVSVLFVCAPNLSVSGTLSWHKL